MTVFASSFEDDPLKSERKREKTLQFEWKILVVVCAILFIFAISVVATSILLYFVFCPGSTPAPTPAPNTTTTPWTSTSPSTTTSTTTGTSTSRTTMTPRTSTLTSTTTSTSTSRSSKTTTSPSTMIFNSEFILPRNSSGGSLRLISRDEWIAAPLSEPLRKLETPVSDVIISHTAAESCNTTSECTSRVRFEQTFDMDTRHWSDIAHNFLVGGDGFAYVGRDWDYEGAATPNYNHRSISISFIGTYNSVAPSTQQLQTAQDLIKLGVELGKIAPDYSLFGQRQLTQTMSPGDELYKIIQTWPHWRALL